MVEQVSSLKTGVKSKDTPIGKIPVDWEVVKLGHVSELKNGINFRKEQKVGKGILTVDVMNMYSTSIFIDPTNLYRVNLDLINKEDYILKEGDILFVRSSVKKEGVGWACLFKAFNEDVTFCGFIIRARLKGPKMSPEFLTYFLRSDRVRGRLISGAGQVAITNISQNALQDLDIVSPSYREQKQIAGILSTVDDAIEKTDQVIDKTKELKKGLMQRLLTRGIGHEKFKKTKIGEIPVEWEFVNLGKIIYLQGGFAFKSNDYEGKGLPLVRISNVTPNGVMLNECVCLPDSFAEQFSTFLLEPGDVLVAMSGATTGKIGVVPNKDLPALFNQRVGRFVIKDSNLIAKSYLAQVALTKRFKQDLLIDAAGGAQPNVSGKNIEKITIPIPPLQEQKKIADILSSIDDEIKKESNHKEQLETLKKGLMQVLLTGKLRVAV